MNQIRILSEKVAIRIAAGEVIDRPSSVVRELVDNSIDAGADRIVVSIGRGGKSLIRVSDNGVGMSRDDLLLCIERHATSKIHDADDLMAISSLGFRGEALASIAAVSRLTITTRQKEALVGHRLKVSGGRVQDVEEIGTAKGTTVEVRDLFYNIPARKKFLRTVRAEADSIVDVFARHSLGFENIHFSLENEQRTIMNLPSSNDLIPRLTAVLGRAVADQMVSVSTVFPGFHLRAYLGLPDFARTRADKLYVYVNKRNVRDKLVNKAVVEGYGRRLMKGLYPQAVIFIDVDPSLVDVNVHPAKQEVRFRDSASLFKEIVRVVDEGLGAKIYSFNLQEAESNLQASEPVQMTWGEIEGQAPIGVSEDYGSVDEQGGQVPLLQGHVRILGQLNYTYILCEGADGLVIVDQHAAHERVLYEKLMKGIQENGLEIQRLLLPKTLELSIREKRVLEQKNQMLADFGIEVEDFGGQTILLCSVPSLLEGADWEILLGEVISALEQGQEKEHLLGKVISLMACHGAIRAGYPMKMAEMQALLDQLNQTGLPTNCPHGRPIFRKITFFELEKMFKRVV